jgi:hypothetical protein
VAVKTRFLLLVCCLTLFSLFFACSLYYAMTRVDSKFYNDGQKKLLWEICDISGYGTGFDEDMSLDYFFIKNQSKVAAKNTERAVRDALKSAGEKDSVELFERILYLHELTLYVMKYHENIENWSGYTYLNKYILPPLENYEALLQKNVSNLYAYSVADIKRKEFAKKIDDELKGRWDADLWQTIR